MDAVRKNWADAARGIGIVLVVFSHCYGFGENGYYLIAGYMPLFFVLSGYFMKTNVSFQKEIEKRAKTLLLPYFIYGSLLVLLAMIMKIISGSFTFEEMRRGLFGVLYSRYCLYPLEREENVFFLFNGNSPLWFLTALFVTSALVKLSFGVRRDRKKYVVIVYFILACFLAELPVLLPWSLDTAFVASLFMLFGIWLRKTEFEVIPIRKAVQMAALLLLVYIGISKYNGEVNTSVRVYGIGGGVD